MMQIATKRGGAEPERSQQDVVMDVVVGYVLRGGVLLSAMFLVAGLFWKWWITGGFSFAAGVSGVNLYEFFVTEVRQLAAGELHPGLLVDLGLVVLLATPYVRVLASMVYFLFVERDVKYSLFTAFVFAVLTYSLLLR